jgi:hypothetical protein
MARPPVNYGQFNGDALTPDQRRLADPGLRPVASPTDAFVRPVNTLDPNVGAKASQLATALGSLAPSLNRFAMGMQDRSNKRNLEEGQIAAAEAARQGLSYKEAVDKGLMQRTSNPFFVRGAKEQFGRIAADRMHTELAVSLEETLKDETDPAKVQKALQDAQTTWVQTNVGEDNDGEFQTGFSFRAASHLDQLRGQLLQRASRNLESRSDAALFSEVRKHISDTVGNLPMSEVAKDLNTLREDMLAEGRDAQAVDKALMKAIGETMLEKNGKDVSELFDMVKGSSGLALRDVFGEKSSEYVRGVINLHHSMWRQTGKEKEEDERKRVADVLDNAAEETVARLMDNPQATLDDIIRKYGKERGALAAITEAAKQVYGVNAIEDPEVAEDLYIDVYSNGIRKAEVLTRLKRGEISLSTASKAVSWIRSRDGEDRALAANARAEARAEHQVKDQERRERSALLNDPQLKAAVGNLKRTFSDESKPWLTKDSARRREYAQAQMVDAWLRWKETDEGQTADLRQTNAWLLETSNAIQSAQWNESVGGKFSGEKNAVPSSLTPIAKSDANKRPALTQADIQSVYTTKQASPAVIAAARKAGVDVNDKAAVLSFIKQQAALYKTQAK